MFFIGLSVAGLAVVAFCAGRVFVAVRGLGRELQRTRERLEPKRIALHGAARSLERARE